MACDFRNRSWIDEPHRLDTIRLLRSLRHEGVTLVASDDLEHELNHTVINTNTTLQNDYHKIAPLLLTALPSPQCLYIRIHRRQGNSRILKENELENWIKKLNSIVNDAKINTIPNRTEPHFFGPIYVLWGTDHENQGIINAQNLFERLPIELKYDWKSNYGSNNLIDSLLLGKSNSHGDNKLTLTSNEENVYRQKLCNCFDQNSSLLYEINNQHENKIECTDKAADKNFKEGSKLFEHKNISLLNNLLLEHLDLSNKSLRNNEYINF
jgi:hypothetical protein